MASTASRIALFGGSFDPPHVGHMLVAAEARRLLRLDRVVMIPCGQSPLKDATPRVEWGHRLEMLKALVRGTKWLELDGSELQCSGPSYSYHTAMAWRTRMPDSELFWIMGSDQWAQLPRWKHPEKFSAVVTPLVFPRPSMPCKIPGHRCVRLPVRVDVSSSQIRDALASGGDIKFLVPETIQRYINKHRLYHDNT